MSLGDRVQVICPGDVMEGEIGTFVDLTPTGFLVVQFDGGDPPLELAYDAHDLELAPVTLWELAGISGTVAA